jgi:hypothetical protein
MRYCSVVQNFLSHSLTASVTSSGDDASATVPSSDPSSPIAVTRARNVSPPSSSQTLTRSAALRSSVNGPPISRWIMPGGGSAR